MALNERAVVIPAKANKKIELKAIAGHFATSHSHINYYLDITPIKCNHEEAKLTSKQMAKKYINSKEVDTIVCMDGCEVIGAFLAEELSANGLNSINEGKGINVIVPEINSSGQLIFRDNVEPMVVHKHVVIIVANATTGKTIKKCIEAIKYYGGIVEGVSAIFSAVDAIYGVDVDSIYSIDDVANYKTYSINDCPFCAEGRRIDAIVNSFGYSKI
ncbi:MAG: orotate phosphoribosyltransferase [Lachnospiraceae bacterium]|nr:orotate phosphoribosyltransferase [Lachnospiraceae bacterium]